MNLEVSQIAIDVEGILRKARAAPLWTFAAREWHRLYLPYVPSRSGTLARQVTISPGLIEHTAPYAARVYAGNFSFRKDRHPLASRLWDQAALGTQKPELVRKLQGFIDEGGLKLDG